jgi:hypothetical protein
MVAVSLRRPQFAPTRDANAPFQKKITIRPDAKTGWWNWPCRELNSVLPSSNNRTRASVNVSLASFAWLAKLDNDLRRGAAGQTVPLRLTPSSSHPSSVYWERTMSIFGKIMSAIFGTKADAAPAGGGAAAGAESSGGSPAPAAATVDVAPILDKAVAAKGEKLAWRTSIVDLMKALDIDSSFAARERTRLHRRQQRFRQHEHLAAQAGHGQAGCQWRQAAARTQELTLRPAQLCEGPQ